MAGDTAITDRDMAAGNVVKVFQRGSMMIGLSGCFSDTSAFRDWFVKGSRGQPPLFRDDDSEVLLAHRDGTIEWYGGDRRRYVMENTLFTAIGSGMKIAMGAMEAGASAEEALRIACKLDIYTREPVTVLSFKGGKRGARR